MSSHVLHRGAEKACINSSVERGYEGTAASSWSSTARWPYSTDRTQRWGGWRSRKTTAVTQVWNTVCHVEKVLFTVCVEIAIFKDGVCGSSISLVWHITLHLFVLPLLSFFTVRWGRNVLNLLKVFQWKVVRHTFFFPPLSGSYQSLCFSPVIEKQLLKLQNQEMKKKGIETKRVIEIV